MSNETPAAFREALVLAVKRQEILYNNTCPDDNAATLAWAAVARETGRDLYSCKRQWSHIKATYEGFLTRQKFSTDSLPAKKPRWHLYHHMSFLKKYLTHNKSGERNVSNKQDLSASQDGFESIYESCGVSHVSDSEQLSLEMDSTDASWGPIYVVENADHVESEEETEMTENPISQTTTHDPSINKPVVKTTGTGSESIVTIELPPYTPHTAPPLQNEKRKRPASLPDDPVDPVQTAFLTLIKEKRRKLAQPAPVVDPELQLFQGLVPFIRQLTEKNKRRFVSKTTSLLMDLLNFQDHNQRS